MSFRGCFGAIRLSRKKLEADLQSIPAGGKTMGILAWILFGLVVGIIAKLLMPGRDPGGFIVTILLGIAGALLGGFIGRAMGFYGENEGAGWIVSILGAILLLGIYRMMVRRRV
jgi:uncharacterized membrane protein YeaQ/YmgE (transglycosylase-associated protein family)